MRIDFPFLSARHTKVWEKMKAKSKTEDFRPDVMEEYEDQDGNVFNKKT